jgi:hypothetical protein
MRLQVSVPDAGARDSQVSDSLTWLIQMVYAVPQAEATYVPRFRSYPLNS